MKWDRRCSDEVLKISNAVIIVSMPIEQPPNQFEEQAAMENRENLEKPAFIESRKIPYIDEGDYGYWIHGDGTGFLATVQCENAGTESSFYVTVDATTKKSAENSERPEIKHGDPLLISMEDATWLNAVCQKYNGNFEKFTEAVKSGDAEAVYTMKWIEHYIQSVPKFFKKEQGLLYRDNPYAVFAFFRMLWKR